MSEPTHQNILLQDLTKIYGRGGSAVEAVSHVDLDIAAGELFFLLGPSGCGKTTLLRMIAGLITPSGGCVRFGDRDVTYLPVEDRNTAMVFQNYALWPHMTVGQNVEFGPRMRKAPAPERRRLAAESLQRVEMEDYARRRPNQLSGGQQQRVALARALAARPACLLLDEPLSNLDARLRLHMRGQLRGLVKSTGTTGIYVTHDQKEALSMADRIAVMRGGKVVQVGTPEALYNRPATHFVADFLGEANFLPGTLLARSPHSVVQTPGAIVRGPETDLPENAAVSVCVRPERIRLVPAAQHAPREGESAIDGTVASCTFLGEIRQYVVRLGAGGTWRVTSLSDASGGLGAGQSVKLTFRPQDAALLAGGVPDKI